MAEFFGELLVGHRIRGAALAEVGLALDHLAVVELDLDDRRHLVEARGLGFGMHAEMHLADHRLHVGAVDDLVGELLEAALALEQQDGHAELHAELGLQLVLRPMVDQRVGHVVVGADRHALHRSGLMSCLRMSSIITAMPGCVSEPRGMRLDRDAGEVERPWVAELPSIISGL